MAVLLGAAAVAPLTMSDSRNGVSPVAMEERLFQQFVPNANPLDDLILPEVPVEKLPDPEPSVPAKTSTALAAPLRYTGGGSPAEWMAEAGIAESDWGYVDYIVTRESHWNPNATNASSGACGLVQALPCSKVPGSGYNPVDNLRWANGYATNRYGSWEKAYYFWTTNHWW